MESKKRIVLAEDHTIFRECLRAIISSQSNYEIVDEAKDGLEAIRAAERLSPDLMLIDLSMPKVDGIEAIREIKSRDLNTKILVLTAHQDELYAVAALKAGADGYVLKDSAKEELLTALQIVCGGKKYISPNVADKVTIDSSRSFSKKESTPWESLTRREREVLTLIAKGHSNKEISSILSIASKTVGTHRTNLMRKLDLHNVSEVTAYAVKRGIIQN